MLHTRPLPRLLSLGLCAGSLLALACQPDAPQAADKHVSKRAPAPTQDAADAPSKTPTPPEAPASAPETDIKTVRAGASTPAADTVIALARDFKSCVSDCHGAATSKTNRETCLLTCEQVADTRAQSLPPEEPKDLVRETLPRIKDSLTRCLAECSADAKLSANDRETCKLTCDSNAELLIDTLAYAKPDAPQGDDDADDELERAEPGDAQPQANAAGANEAPDGDEGEEPRSCEDTCNARAELCAQVCDNGISTKGAPAASESDLATCKVMCEANVRFCVDACRDAAD